MVVYSKELNEEVKKTMIDLDKLKELRSKKGLSQMDVARLCNVSLNAYIRWEKRCSNPTEENKSKLEEILR